MNISLDMSTNDGNDINLGHNELETASYHDVI